MMSVTKLSLAILNFISVLYSIVTLPSFVYSTLYLYMYAQQTQQFVIFIGSHFWQTRTNIVWLALCSLYSADQVLITKIPLDFPML